MIHPLCEKDWPPPGTPLTLAQYHAATGWQDGILCQANGPGARIFYGLGPEPGYRTDTPDDLTPYSGAALLAQYAAGGYTVFRVTHLAADKYWCVHYWPLAVESAVTP